MCTFVFLVLPVVDMIRGLGLMSAACFIPALFKLAFCKPPLKAAPNVDMQLSADDKSEYVTQTPRRPGMGNLSWTWLWRFAHFVAMTIQMGTTVAMVLGYFEFSQGPSKGDKILPDSRDISLVAQAGHSSNTTSAEGPNSPVTIYEDYVRHVLHRDLSNQPSVDYMQLNRWLIPLALTVLSLTWWENFIDMNLSICCKKFFIPLRKWKVGMHVLREKSSMLSSVWNTGIILAFPFIVYEDFQLDIYVFNYKRKSTARYLIDLSPALTQVLASWVGHLLGTLSCRLLMQKTSFNFPLLLAAPVTVVLILLQCVYHYIPDFGFYVWHCPEWYSSIYDFTMESGWQFALCVLWWVSQFIITGYIWWPMQNPMDRTEK